MNAVEDFLSQMLPRYDRAVDEMHRGDHAGFGALWSRTDPVTLLGAAGSAVSGWENVTHAQARVASQFSPGTPMHFRRVSADVDGDLAYTVGYERSTVSVRGGAPRPAVLRATQIYRRENGDWRLVHRHADPAGSPTTDTLRAHSKRARPIPRGELGSRRDPWQGCRWGRPRPRQRACCRAPSRTSRALIGRLVRSPDPSRTRR